VPRTRVGAAWARACTPLTARHSVVGCSVCPSHSRLLVYMGPVNAAVLLATRADRPCGCCTRAPGRSGPSLHVPDRVPRVLLDHGQRARLAAGAAARAAPAAAAATAGRPHRPEAAVAGQPAGGFTGCFPPLCAAFSCLLCDGRRAQTFLRTSALLCLRVCNAWCSA
jgi:hypothetical protein